MRTIEHHVTYARKCACPQARLAQSVERKALNLVVVGSSPTVGVFLVNARAFAHAFFISGGGFKFHWWHSKQQF